MWSLVRVWRGFSNQNWGKLLFITIRYFIIIIVYFVIILLWFVFWLQFILLSKLNLFNDFDISAFDLFNKPIDSTICHTKGLSLSGNNYAFNNLIFWVGESIWERNLTLCDVESAGVDSLTDFIFKLFKIVHDFILNNMIWLEGWRWSVKWHFFFVQLLWWSICWNVSGAE